MAYPEKIWHCAIKITSGYDKPVLYACEANKGIKGPNGVVCSFPTPHIFLIFPNNFGHHLLA